MMKPSYCIIEEYDDRILIEDLANQHITPSITNKAEEVIEELADSGKLSNHQRLYYIDTDGRVDVLKHNNGKFTGFAFGFDSLNDYNKYFNQQ